MILINLYLKRVWLTLLFIWVFLIPYNGFSQLSVSPTNNASTLVQNLVGTGVSISNVSMVCPSNAAATFTTNNSNLGLSAGILLTTGAATTAVGPNFSGSAGVCNSGGAYAPLTAISGVSTHNACYLTFNFIPTNNTVSFQYVFGSEEYPEFAGSFYNDAFAFFVTGPNPAGGNYNNQNIARLPITNQPVSINTVNHFTNAQYYINNAGGATIQYDGFTTVLTANLNVVPCQQYTITIAIADGGDCTYDSGVFLKSSSFNSGLFQANVTQMTPATCSQGGSATVTATGGMAPYTFTWSNGQTGPTATNLAPGTYTCTVSYVQCNTPITTTVTVVIPGPQPIQSSVGSISHVTCNGGNNGAASIQISGGTPPYTVQWSHGAIGTQINNLSAGTYTATITDASGCTTTRTVTINQPIAMVTQPGTVTPPTCHNGTNGSAQVIVSGGTFTYSYQWSPSGGNNPTANNLGPGTYTVTVTDQQGCTAQRTFTLANPPAMQVQVNQVQQVSCNGLNNGSAQVGVSGGTGNLSYLWTPSGGTGLTASNLGPGTYTFTVTDQNNCTQSVPVVISQPATLNVSVPNPTPVSCFGQNNGAATAVVTGGVAPYVYQWNPGGANTASITGLAPGNYSLMVADANGCIAQTSTQITQPQPLVAQIPTVISPSCFQGTNGSAASQVSGGTQPYAYAWNPTGQTGATATQLGAGTYTLTVTDARGCTHSATATLVQPAQIILTLPQITQINCFNANNGAITAQATGGTGSLSYQWSPSGGIQPQATGLGPGTYTVTVTDQNNCTAAQTAQISQPPQLTLTTTLNQAVTCNGMSNGAAAVQANGGVPPYTFQWNPGGVSTPNITGLAAGSYVAAVIDQNQCTTQQTIVVQQPPVLQTSIVQNTPVSCFGGNNGSLTAVVSGGNGNYQYAWSPSGGNQLQASGLTAGSYTFTVTDPQNCSATATATVVEPSALQHGNPVMQHISCAGGNNGSIQLPMTGGTAPYQFQWGPGLPNLAQISNVPAGNYAVTVTDANGCTLSWNGTLTEPPPLVLGAVQTQNISCFGQNNGQINLPLTGGMAPYVVQWNNGTFTGQQLSNLSPGTYQAAITDANGCPLSYSTTLTQPPVLQAVLTLSDDSICAGDALVVSATASGGTTPYSGQWNGLPGLQQTFFPTQHQVFTFTLTDALGCTLTLSQQVRVGDLPQASIQTLPACTGQPFSFQSTSSVGEGFIQQTGWVINNQSFQGTQVQQTFQTQQPISATLWVVTNYGCVDTAVLQALAHPSPQLQFSAGPTSGCIPFCSQMVNQSTIANGQIVQYQWSVQGQSDQTSAEPLFCFNAPGTFDVQLTALSDQGCLSTLVMPNLIQAFPTPSADFLLSKTQVNLTEAFIQFNNLSVGGELFTWDFGDGSPLSNEEEPAHNYRDTGTYCITLTATNLHGCEDTVQHCLRVIPEGSVYIPSAFTPNKDKINDGFRVYGMGIVAQEMQVFDRWGGRVFYSDKIDAVWNGRRYNEGDVLKQDVYTYRVHVRVVSGVWKEYHGKVSLIR